MRILAAASLGAAALLGAAVLAGCGGARRTTVPTEPVTPPQQGSRVVLVDHTWTCRGPVDLDLVNKKLAKVNAQYNLLVKEYENIFNVK